MILRQKVYARFAKVFPTLLLARYVNYIFKIAVGTLVYLKIVKPDFLFVERTLTDHASTSSKFNLFYFEGICI